MGCRRFVPHRLASALLALALVSTASHAQEEAGSVWLANAQVDEHGSWSLGAGLDHGVTEATWLRVSAGLTESADAPFALSTVRGALGLDHLFDPVGLAADVDYWGDSDTIEALTLSAELYFRGERARLGLRAARRDIDLQYEVPEPARNLVDANPSYVATGFGANFRYSTDAVSLYASGMAWDYDDTVGTIDTTVDLSRVPVLLRPAIQQRLARLVSAVSFLSTSSLTMANSLLAHSASVGFEYRAGDQAFNVEVGQDRGEVDDIDLRVVSAGWLFPAGDSVDVELRIGASDADTFGTTVFGGISLYLYR